MLETKFGEDGVGSPPALLDQHALTQALRAIMPEHQRPDPPLQECLLPYHETSVLSYNDRWPFAQQNTVGMPRIYMPTLVSFLRSNAHRSKPDGSLEEGEFYNVIYER